MTKEIRCHAKGCPLRRDGTLMCRKHWRMVPDEIQMEVHRFYSSDQEINGPTCEFLAAALRAIRSVAEAESGAQRGSK